MSNREEREGMADRSRDDELLGSSLAGGTGCPPLEQLEDLIGAAAPSRLKGHVSQCLRCQVELQMLRWFTLSLIAPHEKSAVDSIAGRLKARLPEIGPRRVIEHRRTRWAAFFAASWRMRAAAALTIVLVLAGLALQMKQGTMPPLETMTGRGEILRSSAIAITNPLGDVRNKPAGIRWEPMPNARGIASASCKWTAPCCGARKPSRHPSVSRRKQRA